MKQIVCKIFFCILHVYEQLHLLKTVIFMRNLLYLSKKRPKINLKVFHLQLPHLDNIKSVLPNVLEENDSFINNVLLFDDTSLVTLQIQYLDDSISTF